MIAGVTRISEYEWEVPIGYAPRMRVPGKFFLSDSLAATLEEGAVKQTRQCRDYARNRLLFPCDA